MVWQSGGRQPPGPASRGVRSQGSGGPLAPWLCVEGRDPSAEPGVGEGQQEVWEVLEEPG